jgi:hypothetical protein
MVMLCIDHHADTRPAARRRTPRRVSHIPMTTTHHPQHHSPTLPLTISPFVTLYPSAHRLNPTQNAHHVPSPTYRRTITWRPARSGISGRTPKPQNTFASSSHQPTHLTPYDHTDPASTVHQPHNSAIAPPLRCHIHRPRQ